MSNLRYDLFGPPLGGGFVRLLYVSSARFGGDWHSLKHTHGCVELFYILSGSGFFEIDLDRFDVTARDLIIVNPYVEHTEHGDSVSPLEYIVLGIEGLEIAGAPSGSTYRSFNCGEEDDTDFYIRAILREMEGQQPGHEQVCQHLLAILMQRLNRVTLERLVTAPALRKSSKECAKIRRYIDANFTESITLNTLASLTHMNKYHMAHIFNDEIGCSPISYLFRRRITESQRLLVSTDHSIAQISGMLGFSSQSYFSQRFKKAVGMGPAQYRRQAKMSKLADGVE